METIAGGKTPGLCLVEALPAEVVAFGISICDTTRDGSRIVRQTFPYQIMEELLVIRPRSMRSAEITPYKPTYRGLMLPASVL